MEILKQLLRGNHVSSKELVTARQTIYSIILGYNQKVESSLKLELPKSESDIMSKTTNQTINNYDNTTKTEKQLFEVMRK